MISSIEGQIVRLVCAGDCVSVHGANRLGKFITRYCCVWACRCIWCSPNSGDLIYRQRTKMNLSERITLDALENSNNSEDPNVIRRKQACHAKFLRCVPDQERMEPGLEELKDLQQRITRAKYDSKVIRALKR